MLFSHYFLGLWCSLFGVIYIFFFFHYSLFNNVCSLFCYKCVRISGCMHYCTFFFFWKKRKHGFVTGWFSVLRSGGGYCFSKTALIFFLYFAYINTKKPVFSNFLLVFNYYFNFCVLKQKANKHSFFIF